MNVLVPLMARLFRVLLSESKVPACWKVAKLSPIHKKGEVLNPGIYRIAVSGVIYRIFTNVLKDLVTDWCVKKGKIPDTQFGFFPGRSTLQPLFILRHLRHAAKKLSPGTVLDCMLPSLIFCKRMTLSLGNATTLVTSAS